jgi:hypothetical protein
VQFAKLLGVILNDHLKWNEHVGQIVKKASKRQYMSRLLKRACADTKTLLSVYVTCIRPVAQVRHYNLPNYLICVELERIHLRAMRIIYSSLSCTYVLIKYNLPTLATRRNLLCTSFFGKNVLQQSDILSELVQYEHNFNYDLRYQKKLIPYRCRANRFKNSYIPSSIGIFNENCQL